MISEKDLQEAIAECNGTRNPNANTCLKLAAYYTILDHIKDGGQIDQGYRQSFQNMPETAYKSEFMQVAGEKSIESVFAVVDEVMAAISVLHPKLYANAVSKIRESV